MKRGTLLVIWVISLTFLGCRGSQATTDCIGPYPLLNADSYPEGAIVGDVLFPLSDSTIKSSGSTVYLGRGIAVQEVYPYSTERRAEEDFEYEFQSPDFSSSLPDKRWQIPDELKDFESKADQFALACGMIHGIPICRIIARYNNYFVQLSSYMYPDEMTYAEFEKVIQDLDQRMSGCVGTTNGVEN